MSTLAHSGQGAVIPGAATANSVGHTPGPWVASRYSHVDCWRVLYGDNGNWLADVPIDGDEDGARCDARLIAAAPELLERGAELQVARRAHKLDPNRENAGRVHAASAAFDAAIAKATGQ